MAATVFSAAALSPAYAQDPSHHEDRGDQLTVADWAVLPSDERQMVVIAALESLIMALTNSRDPALVINADCLMNDTPETVDRKMMQVARSYESQPFVDVFLAVTGCYRIPEEAGVLQ